MCRRLLYAILGLCFGGVAATATDRYGEWSLDWLRSNVVTLSYTQRAPFDDNDVGTAELGFICNEKDGSRNFGATLLPFEGTYENAPAAPPLSASSTTFVISSTNRGMPSLRSMISCRMFAGIGSLPATPSIIASTSRRISRLRVRPVTCGCPIHGGSNSGTEGYEQQHGKVCDPVDCPTKCFQARQINK
jgi:hypothetical protein